MTSSAAAATHWFRVPAASRKARAKALSGIDSVAADAAQDIVAKVSGIKVTPAQAAQAVKTVLANG